MLQTHLAPCYLKIPDVLPCPHLSSCWSLHLECPFPTFLPGKIISIFPGPSRMLPSWWSLSRFPLTRVFLQGIPSGLCSSLLVPTMFDFASNEFYTPGGATHTQHPAVWSSRDNFRLGTKKTGLWSQANHSVILSKSLHGSFGFLFLKTVGWTGWDLKTFPSLPFRKSSAPALGSHMLACGISSD